MDPNHNKLSTKPELFLSQTIVSLLSCVLGRLIGHNLLNINTANSLLMMNGVQSPLASPHAGRVSSPSPLITATTPGNNKRLDWSTTNV